MGMSVCGPDADNAILVKVDNDLFGKLELSSFSNNLRKLQKKCLINKKVFFENFYITIYGSQTLKFSFSKDHLKCTILLEVGLIKRININKHFCNSHQLSHLELVHHLQLLLWFY